MGHSAEVLIKKGLTAVLTHFRPLLGPSRCRYPVGCTAFAVQCLAIYPLWRALWLTMRRVVSCNPWCRPCVDLW